jgi:hypothetical protein
MRVFDAGLDNPQKSYDVAVVIPTILRNTLREAIESIYRQKNVGRIQILIGIDVPEQSPESFEPLFSSCPKHCSVFVFYPGYSTSARNGGLHAAFDGGTLRTVLSYLANSRYLAYLDDDNYWDEFHLTSMLTAIRGVDWVYSLRWFLHPKTRAPICIDEWESVGVDTGIFAEKFGGFVDPNQLLIDKLVCEPVLRLWGVPLSNDPEAMSADRNVFGFLRQYFKRRSTDLATVYYYLSGDESYHRLKRPDWAGPTYVLKYELAGRVE